MPATHLAGPFHVLRLPHRTPRPTDGQVTESEPWIRMEVPKPEALRRAPALTSLRGGSAMGHCWTFCWEQVSCRSQPDW